MQVASRWSTRDNDTAPALTRGVIAVQRFQDLYIDHNVSVSLAASPPFADRSLIGAR